MGAEMTATMIVWPRPCGHGGMVLELVEHFRPYWLGRTQGRRVTAPVPSADRVLSSGLALACRGTRPNGRRMTILRYAGCILGDAEIDRARRAGAHIEVVDVDGNTHTERSAS